MNAALHLVITLVICTFAVRPLARARWVWRAPRTGIVLWQLLALTWILCAIGACVAIGLAPYGTDIPAAFGKWLGAQASADFTALHLVVLGVGCGLALALPVAFGICWYRVLKVRRRHRQVLELVGRQDPAVPGALILDHPLAVAYCLPGIRGKVVLSSGAVHALTPDQLAAVLAHEQTHVRERHDLVLLPFTAFRWVKLVDVAAEAVALLVEMRADEGACRQQAPGALATALRRFTVTSPPPGALGVSDTAVSARLERISGHSAPLPAVVRWMVVAAGLVFVSTPLSFLIV